MAGNRLLPDNDPFAGPDLADAWDANKAALNGVVQRMQAEREKSVAMGLLDPKTGWPTPEGWKQAAMAYVNGLGDSGGIGLMGAVKNFHGSPRPNLTMLSSAPPVRQFDNATSQFGAFTSPNISEARRYAGEGGYIYETTQELKNPYEMPWSDFSYFQNIHKGKNGETLPGEQWNARAQELMQEALALKQKLQSAGHDGIIVRARGIPKEIAYFSDTPVNRLVGGDQ